MTPRFSVQTFPSKRDAWILIVIWAGAILCSGAAVAQLLTPGPTATRALLFVVLLATTAFSFWVLYGTNYTLDDDQLTVRSGPIRYRVPLDSIRSAKPSRNPLSSPACSLDRLLIEWDEGRRRILISPESKQLFLQELALRCSQLRLTGSTLSLRELADTGR